MYAGSAFASLWQIAPQELLPIPAAVAEKCKRDPDDRGVCRCLQSVFRQGKGGGPPQGLLGKVMVAAYAARTECKAAKALVGDMITRVVALAEDRVDKWTKQDRKAVMHLTLDGNSSKRRRMVESDLKEYVCLDVLKDGKSYSSGSWAKGNGTAASTACGWDEAFMAEYLAALRLAGNLVGTLSLAPDAARFGSPAQETIMMPCYIANLERSCWLPPQARWERLARGGAPVCSTQP